MLTLFCSRSPNIESRKGETRFGAMSLFHKSLSRLSLTFVVALLVLGFPPGAQPVPHVSTSSNPFKEYVIYSSVDGSAPDIANERIRLHLGMILSPADVQEFGGDYTGVEFWRVVMSDTQRTAFASANPSVSDAPAKGFWQVLSADHGKGSSL